MHDFQKFGRCAPIKFPGPYSAAPYVGRIRMDGMGEPTVQ